MAKSGQIHIAVDEAQKDRWQAYVEDSAEYESLTDLIRVSVETEISEENTDKKAVSTTIENDLSDLIDNVNRIRKDVSWLRRQHQDEEDISTLAQNVFDELKVLPKPKSSTEIPEKVDDEQTYRQQKAAIAVLTPDDAEEAEEVGQRSFTVSDLAQRFDTTEDRIEDAIAYLEDHFLPVVAVDVEGETHYFKEE